MNFKETDRQTQHECFDASLSYRKEKKYEEEIEETDHHQGSQRSFHTGSCSVMSSEDEERGDALPISWSDPGLAYLLLDEATDERENPMDNNNGFRGGKILGSRRHPAVEEIGDDDEDNGKRSSWSAPSGLNDLRCARNLISPHSFDVPESPECTDAIRSPQIHEPLVRQNTDYYGDLLIYELLQAVFILQTLLTVNSSSWIPALQILIKIIQLPRK